MSGILEATGERIKLVKWHFINFLAVLCCLYENLAHRKVKNDVDEDTLRSGVCLDAEWGCYVMSERFPDE